MDWLERGVHVDMATIRGQCWQIQALKLARRVMRHEEVVLGLAPVSAVSTPEDVA
jgi:hypothetical protein